MAGKSANLQITGGSLFIQLYSAAGVLADDLLSFGSTDEITLTNETEKVEHMSTEGSIPVLDGDTPVGQTSKLSFTSSDITPEMMARAYLGTSSDVDQSAAVDAAVVTAGVVYGGRYDGGYRNCTSILVKDVTDTTTYVEGTHYTVNIKGGYIVILEHVDITETDVLHLTVNAPAGTGTLINAMQLDALQAKLIYTGDAAVGDNHEYTFTKVTLTQSGDISLKSKEYTQISFEGSILEVAGSSYTTETY